MTPEEISFQCTASLETLRKRSDVLGQIRQFFEQRKFIHVETPLLSRDSVVDRYIDPVTCLRSNVVDSSGDEKLYLQTSPEFAMKRLLASGASAIFQICKAFRKGESRSRHNPEFKMLEWYRVGDDLEAGMQLLADLALRLFKADQVDRISYRDAFLQYASVDPFAASVEQLRSACASHKVDAATFADDADRDTWLNLMMSEVVEPFLGRENPTIVFHWPASQSALAQVCLSKHGHEVAERFELFVQGVELANGYHELVDPDELEARNNKVNQQRLSDGREPLPNESSLLRAMQHGLPGCSGVALGVDRLLMVLLGKASIDDVIAFPFRRA